jgi:hypothetical protein
MNSKRKKERNTKHRVRDREKRRNYVIKSKKMRERISVENVQKGGQKIKIKKD